MTRTGITFSVKQKVKMLSQNAYLPVVYGLFRFSGTDRNLVIFADAHHDRRPEAMDLLFRRLRKDGVFRIEEMYLDFGRASAAQVLAFSTRFMRRYAKASAVVLCDNFLPAASCRKKEGTLVVQLWHACGCYKKFGYDAPDDIPEGYRGDVFRNMDLVTVSAEAAVAPFSSAMRKHGGEVQALGVSRTDLYFSRKWRGRCLENFRKRYPEPAGDADGASFSSGTLAAKKTPAMKEKGSGIMPPAGAVIHTQAAATTMEEKGSGIMPSAGVDSRKEPRPRRKVVLWAPTFRGNAGEPELLRFDAERLQKELGDGYLVLTRLHPHMKQAQKTGSHECPIPTEQLYPAVDVLIADYSSLVYEYLLVSKLCEGGEMRGGKETQGGRNIGGLILYVPDLDTYERRRGFYMDIREIPGEIVKSASGLADAVRREASGQDPGRAAARDAFLNRYMSACDGHATERIAERIRRHCFS